MSLWWTAVAMLLPERRGRNLKEALPHGSHSRTAWMLRSSIPRRKRNSRSLSCTIAQTGIFLCCTFMLGQHGCTEGPGLPSRETALVVWFDWNPSKGQPEDFPTPEVGGRLLTHWSGETFRPTIVSASAKTIDGARYMGAKIYHGEGCRQERPEALVCEIYARRVSTPTNSIEIRLRCKVPTEVRVRGLSKSQLVDVKSGQTSACPRVFPPGDYHLYLGALTKPQVEEEAAR